MGYRVTEIARSLSALSLEDRHNIDRALAHISLSYVPSDRAKSSEACVSDRRDSFTATSMFSEQPSLVPFLFDRGGQLRNECGVGLMSLMFDPNSGHRRQLLVNLQQARNPFKPHFWLDQRYRHGSQPHAQRPNLRARRAGAPLGNALGGRCALYIYIYSLYIYIYIAVILYDTDG